MRGPLDGTGTEGWCGVEGEKEAQKFDANECQCKAADGKPLNQCNECPR